MYSVLFGYFQDKSPQYSSPDHIDSQPEPKGRALPPFSLVPSASMPVPCRALGLGYLVGLSPQGTGIPSMSSGPPASSPSPSRSLSHVVSGAGPQQRERMSHRDQSPPRPGALACRDSWACPQLEAFRGCSVGSSWRHFRRVQCLRSRMRKPRPCTKA